MTIHLRVSGSSSIKTKKTNSNSHRVSNIKQTNTNIEMIDRANKNWDNEISDEEIFNREFSIGYLIQTNQHLPIFRELKDLVLSTYKVIARFDYLGYNGNTIYANGQKLVYRKSKFSKLIVGSGVKVLEHNLSTEGGGSNKYPTVSRESGYIVLEFTSYGLPFVNKTNGWSIKVISIEKI